MSLRSHWGARRTWWLARTVGFAFCISAFAGAFGAGIGPHHHVLAAVQLTVIGVLLSSWATLDLLGAGERRLGHPWLRLAILVALAGFGGISAELKVQDITIAYAANACYEAGDELSDGRLALVFGAGLAAVELSGVLFGFGTGPSIGWPLALVTTTALGRLHRQSSQRGERLAALMQDMRRSEERGLRAAAIEERQRIARDLHDVLAHSLSALGLQIEAARAVLVETDDLPKALALLDGAQALADQGLTESRAAIQALRPESPPLPEALRGIVGAHNHDHAGRAELTISGRPRPLTPEASITLIRVAGEAVANAERYAPGRALEILLRYDDDVTVLRVANTRAAGPDDPARDGSGGGFGLAGMGERLRLAGGTLAAGPSGDGWVVTARVPR